MELYNKAVKILTCKCYFLTNTYEAINLLDEKYKEALVLHRIAGLQGQEIAEISGVSAECIRKRSQRALAKLKIIIMKLNKDIGNE